MDGRGVPFATGYKFMNGLSLLFVPGPHQHTQDSRCPACYSLTTRAVRLSNMPCAAGELCNIPDFTLKVLDGRPQLKARTVMMRLGGSGASMRRRLTSKVRRSSVSLTILRSRVTMAKSASHLQKARMLFSKRILPNHRGRQTFRSSIAHDEFHQQAEDAVR